MLVVFAFILHGAKKSVIKIQEANRCEYYHCSFLQLCESPVWLYVLLSAFPAADTERRVELKGGIKGLGCKEHCTGTFVLGKKFRVLVPSQSNMEGLSPKALA